MPVDLDLPHPLHDGPLVFDWNEVDPPPRPATLEVADETLRDGLQSPSVRDPDIGDKLAMLHHMARLGIHCAAIGSPISHGRQFDDTLRLAKEIGEQKLPITAYAAARTVLEDVARVVDVAQQAGLPLAVATFVGSSPIRLGADNWAIDRIRRHTEEAVSFAVMHDLPVMFVTEDTTRTPRETLRKLYGTAVGSGATRVCICDTVGHAMPRGTAALVRFLRNVVGDPSIAIDWHGHRDRGFDLANAFAAWEAGAQRCHGTALGVGERCGNAPIEQLLVNLRLIGWAHHDLTALPEYIALASRALGMPIPANQPIVGADALRAATGVHAPGVDHRASYRN
jgi:2-isopropylmalate synthase